MTGMTADPSPPHETPWAWELSPAELTGALATLRITPDTLSPLGGWCAAEPAVPHVPVEDFASALRVMASPERLLILVEVGASTATRAALFLSDSRRVVPYRMENAGLRLDTPISVSRFATYLAALAGSANAESESVDFIGRRLLATVGGLLESSSEEQLGGRLPAETVTSIVERFLPKGRSVTVAIDALQRDDVLIPDGTGFVLAPAWLDRYRYIIERERIELLSIELIDAAEGVWAPRTLSIVGSPPARRLTASTPLDDALGLDDLRGFATLTRQRLLIATAAMLDAPWCPPAIPPEVVAFDPAMLSRDTPTTCRNAEGWQISSLPDLLCLARDRNTAARALLRPGVTLTAVSRRAGELRPRRRWRSAATARPSGAATVHGFAGGHAPWTVPEAGSRLGFPAQPVSAREPRPCSPR